MINNNTLYSQSEFLQTFFCNGQMNRNGTSVSTDKIPIC